MGQLIATTLLSLGLWAYWPTLWQIVAAWNSDPDYSHGYLVIPLALYFLWIRQQLKPRSGVGFHAFWLALLLLAALLRYTSGRLYYPEIDAWSLPLWFGGVVGVLWGLPGLRWAWPSIVFLWFATPMPASIETALSIPLQRTAAALSGVSLQLCGLPAIVEGATILVNDNKLDVERACSGLRMFYGITALAFASIVITRPGFWKSIATLLAVAPVAVLMNVLRITGTGLMLHAFPEAESKEFMHDWAGLLVLPLAMVLFLGLIGLFDRIGDSWRRDSRRTAPWLTGALVGCIVLVLLGAWRYRSQRDLALSTLLATAERHESEGDIPAAIEYLNRYTTARPEDHEQLLHLAEVYASAADTAGEWLRAAELLRTAYLQNPERRDLALDAVDLAVKAKAFSLALDLLDRLRANPTDSDSALIKRKHADVLLAYLNAPEGERQTDFSWTDLAEKLRESLELSNYPVPHAMALAVVTRERLVEPTADERVAIADGLMERLKTDRLEDTEAYLARYRYGLAYADDLNGIDPQAELDAALLHRNEASPEIRAQALTLAAQRVRQDEPASARAYLEEAVEAYPTAILAQLALAELSRAQADTLADGLQAAIDVMRSALASNPDEPLPLVFGLAELLAEQGKTAESQELLVTIRELRSSIADADEQAYADVRIAAVEAIAADRAGDTSEAVELLWTRLASTESVGATRRFPDVYVRAWRRLAEWYVIIGRNNDAVGAWKHVVRIAPDSAAAQASLVEATLAAGDLNTAVFESRNWIARDPDSGAARVALARALLSEQLISPPDQRSFAAVEAALRDASELDPSTPSLVAVYVDLRRAQGRHEQAVSAIQRALEAEPENTDLRRLLSVTFIESGDLEAATESIAELATHGGDPAIVAALRANVSVLSGDTRQALEQLEGSRIRAAGSSQVELALLSAALNRQLGNLEGARSVLADAHRESPRDLRLLENLAQIAITQRDWGELAKYVNRLRKLEGEGGARWKAFRGMGWLHSGEPMDDSRVEQLVELANGVMSARPRWAVGPYLRAQAALFQGEHSLAIEQLERSWRLGLQDAANAQQLLELLTVAGRTQDIERFASRLGDLPLSHPGVYDQVLPTLLRSTQRNAAIDQARNWAEREPENYEVLIRLGRTLLINGAGLQEEEEREAVWSEAEDAFRRAIDVAPQQLTPWMALHGFLLETQQRDKAIALLDRFGSETVLEPLPRAMALAQLHAVAGNTAAAVRHHLAATRESEHEEIDPTAKSTAFTQAATFLAGSSPQYATRLVEEAFQETPKSVQVRLLLATLLGRSGVKEDLDRSIRLLEEAEDAPRSSATEILRLEASLLGKRGQPRDLNRAIESMESIAQPTAGDLRVLADLYEADGRTATAYDLWDRLVEMKPPRPEDHLRFLEFWQDHFQNEGQFMGRARQVSDELGKLPGGLAEQLRWRLRINARGGEREPSLAPDGIVEQFWTSPSVEEVLSDPQQATSLLFSVYKVLLEEGQLAILERITREPSEQSVAPAYAARLLANVLIQSPLREETAVSMVERLLDETIEAYPDDLDLMRDAADLASATGHSERAEQLYQRILVKDPVSTAATNNLVSLRLEESKSLDAALDQIDAILAKHPTDASLHDTRGQILFLQDHHEDAIEEFDQAILLSPIATYAYLHRSVALDRLDRRPEATEALLTALALGIEKQPKLPYDERWLDEMRTRLDL